ncbi:MAG: hypothetical protein QNJ05_14250 [Woeseiaceae bacterium]|nr:hypothetical protein [Woeseiaceae bacterium]
MTSAKKHLSVIIAGLLVSQSAAAQEAIIERCKETSSKDDRIACLEAALLMRDGVEATQIDPPSLQIDAGPAASSVNAETEPPRATSELTEAKPVPMPDEPPRPPIEAQSQEVNEPPAEEPANTPAATGIGSQQVIARSQDRSEKQLEKASGLEVSSYEKLAYEKIQITLENGQVWRQLRSDRQTVRVDLERNQTVDIEESSLGGYRLRLNEMRRVIRVERVR